MVSVDENQARSSLEPVNSMPQSTTLRVLEIYKSIQGESTWAGLPCTFVRLARCHLRCSWCDTAYAFYGGDPLSIEEIVRQCDVLDCSLVEITGGEPLVQEDCPRLAARLLDSGYTVIVETSGTLPISTLPEEAIKIMDLKCPGSGECEKNDWSNIDALSEHDEVKFVIADRNDYEWSLDAVRKHRLADRCNAVLFAPVFGTIDPKSLAQWITEDNAPVRLQIQLHKILWPPDARGV